MRVLRLAGFQQQSVSAQQVDQYHLYLTAALMFLDQAEVPTVGAVVKIVPQNIELAGGGVLQPLWFWGNAFHIGE